jgi:hypothetical protein
MHGLADTQIRTAREPGLNMIQPRGAHHDV